MNANKKVLIIVFVMLGLLSTAIISNVWVQFISFGNKATVEKANSIAESVRDGLTAHMVHGSMNEKSMYLRNMIKHQGVQTLKVIRSQENMKDFEDEKIKYASYDEIEKKVLQTGKTITKFENDFLRITIPYIAYANSEPDCISCHVSTREGDVLGAITLEISTEDVKKSTYKTIAMIVGISMLFLFISYFIARYFIKPYIKLFDDLEEGISRAYRGDFSHQIDTKLKNDAGKVAKRLNDLSEIFKFKKTIELDFDSKTIYERLGYVLQNQFSIKEFVMFENNKKERTKKIVYKSQYFTSLSPNEIESSKEPCRAFRTQEMICSSDFHKICKLCYREKKESLCIPFTISEDFSLSLLVFVNTQNELYKLKHLVPIITNYFELAEPVLQTKILMKQLHDTTLIDPMTGLHNRRFLDNYIEEGVGNHTMYSLMMVDIDLFKEVNDTYGHNVGDDVIKSIARVLKNNIKGSDYAIRFGGEEFLLITFGTTKESALKIANKIREEFSKQLFKVNKKSFSKTLSVGVSNFPEDSLSIWECIKFADVALYHAKESGRDKVVSFEKKMQKQEVI